MLNKAGCNKVPCLLNKIPPKMQPTLKSYIAKYAELLAKPGTVFYTLPLLMALLVAGTIAQRTMGLYDAQKMFFSSFFFWLGPLPLPGGYTVTALIALSLLVKFLFFTTWRLDKTGINLAHLGVLVMLIGGLLTAWKSQEGYIVIPEGGSAATVFDYHQRELVIAANDRIIHAIPHQKIAAGKQFAFDNLPFTIKVHHTCRNCRIDKREETTGDFGQPLRGMARFMALAPAPAEPADEDNLYGATISISGASEESDGVYVLFDIMPEPITLTRNDKTWQIIHTKQQRPLPFSIELVDFEQGLHPGTTMASRYHSDVIIHDDQARWPVRIEMNKPLRYRGYTFFQSSFAESGDETATILSVVRNRGWLFPYIGVAIIAAGLLFHTLFMALTRRQTP